MTASAPPQRVIPLANVHNLRDMGGYRTVDGRETKWGVLYRADALQRVVGDDVEAVRLLGLRTVVDLRTDEEIELRGRFPVAEIPVDYRHVSIIDRAWQHAYEPAPDIDTVDFLVEAYRHMLAEGGERVGRVIRIVAEAGTAPLVFHCAAGKDRTGLVAAFTLAAIGVDDEQILDDYAQTQAAMDRTYEWAERHSPELFERFQTVPKMFMAADPRALEIILATVRRAHGTIYRYLDSIGVDPAVRDRLADNLLG